MGIFDWVVFEDGVDVTVPELEVDVRDVTWQSKSIGRPEMRNYKITRQGRLFKQQVRHESVPPEERPHYDDELEGFESDLDEMCGAMRTVPEGWVDTHHHGIVEIHGTVDEEYISLEARFTDGTLVDLSLEYRQEV